MTWGGKRREIKEGNARIWLNGCSQRATENWFWDFSFWKTNYCPEGNCFHNTKIFEWTHESLWGRIHERKHRDVYDCAYICITQNSTALDRLFARFSVFFSCALVICVWVCELTAMQVLTPSCDWICASETFQMQRRSAHCSQVYCMN